MKEIKTKYNSNIIWVVFDEKEKQYIVERYKEIYSLPKEILDDIRLWISHICKKYNIKYNDIMHLKKYQVWLLIISIKNDNNLKVPKTIKDPSRI